MARTKRKTNPVIPAAEAPAQAQKQYRAAAYARLSVEDSGKPGADTIEGQKALLTSFIESSSDLELAALFCDNGRTGTDFDRPQFEKMMEEVRKGHIDCIVVKDLSRFGRNYKESRTGCAAFCVLRHCRGAASSTSREAPADRYREHEKSKRSRFVIARSEATWQSREGTYSSYRPSLKQRATIVSAAALPERHGD